MALNREAEVRHLGEADSHIADGERRITRQVTLVEELRRDGHDTAEAEKVLATLQQSLETMHGHRQQIMGAIRQIDAGLIWE